MNLQDAIIAATKKVMDRRELSHIWEINCGYCDDWIGEVLKNLDKDVHALSFWIEQDCRLTEDEQENIVHCVLYYEGMFYDCLNTDGNTDPLNLVYRPKHLVDQEHLEEYESAINEISKIIKRGNPPNLWDCKSEAGHHKNNYWM